jgi:cysteine desulfurase family protein
MVKMDFIYLDNAATTFPKPCHVVNSVVECLKKFAVNPRRGINPLVKKANNNLEVTRSKLSNIFRVNPNQLTFVPSATYGINIIIQGMDISQGEAIYISPFEHNSVVRSVMHLKNENGVTVKILPIDENCQLDSEQTEMLFAAYPPRLVVIAHASNVTGDILPIKEVAKITHSFGGKILVDAAQTVGLHTPGMDRYDYDFLAFSSHKSLYGIPGSGGLVIKDINELPAPLVFGGTGNSEDVDMPDFVPERYESGTLPLPSIVSMLAGIEWIERTGIEEINAKVNTLKQELYKGLLDIGVKIYGQTSPYGNIGIISFNVLGFSPQDIDSLLDSKKICVRSGLHCAPIAHKKIGSYPNGTLRVSPAYFNTEKEINVLLDIIDQLYF